MLQMKAAIVLRGAISKKNNKYVNYKLVRDSIYKHIVDVNKDYNFDIFIHSWNVDLQQELISLYNPVSYLFENNEDYRDIIVNKLNECNCDLSFFNQVSQSIAITNSCNVVKNFVGNNENYFNKIILYRPDVLLWKDIKLSEYSDDFIFCNAHGNNQGDFHFIFVQKYLKVFDCLFESINANNKPIPHDHIRTSIIQKYGNILFNDKIIPGLHQEVLRKLDIE